MCFSACRLFNHSNAPLCPNLATKNFKDSSSMVSISTSALLSRSQSRAFAISCARFCSVDICSAFEIKSENVSDIFSPYELRLSFIASRFLSQNQSMLISDPAASSGILMLGHSWASFSSLLIFSVSAGLTSSVATEKSLRFHQSKASSISLATTFRLRSFLGPQLWKTFRIISDLLPSISSISYSLLFLPVHSIKPEISSAAFLRSLADKFVFCHR